MDPHAGSYRLATPTRSKTPSLEDAQQLHLHHERHIPDLIEEERAPPSHFKASLREETAPVKVPFHDQKAPIPVGNRTAVNRDEGTLRPAGSVVNIS